jgi:hypothetical protein
MITNVSNIIVIITNVSNIIGFVLGILIKFICILTINICCLVPLIINPIINNFY